MMWNLRKKLLASLSSHLELFESRSFKFVSFTITSLLTNIYISRPQCNLTISGTFSLLDMHNWLDFCLPGLSEKPTISSALSTTEPTAYSQFVSVFLGTRLACIYSRGKVEFRTENFSTLATLKDVLTKTASLQNVHLQIEFGMISNV